MIRVGLIGCGYIAHKHVQTLSRISEFSLIAVCDIKLEKMKETAALYHKERKSDCAISFYEKYQDLLMDRRIDVVIISVISSLHSTMTKEALKHGKHVIVEKPLALSMQEANEVIQLADDLKKEVFICHQLRHRPLMKKMKEILKEGLLGVPYMGTVSLRLHRSLDYYKSSNWKGTWESDGGMLVNQGIHLIDLLIWLLGDIQSVYGEIASWVTEKETEDIACGVISFKNKAKGFIEANTITKPKNQGYYLSVFAQKGSICIGGPGFNEIHHCYIEGLPHIGEELKKISDKSDDHYWMYRSFFEVISKKTPNALSAKEGKKALEAIFALYESSKRKQPVSVPVEYFSTIDMKDDKSILREESQEDEK